MKAIVIDKYGSPDVLEYREVDKPTLQPDQVLVKVKASSVNPIDWKVRRGDLRLLSGFNFPLRLGSDFAGIVETVGSNEMRQLIEAGKVRSVISQSYSFSEISQAHAASETGKTRGKIVLIPNV